MLFNLSVLSPIRQGAASDGASRRRKERDGERKVRPRHPEDQANSEERPGQDKGRGLNAYA